MGNVSLRAASRYMPRPIRNLVTPLYRTIFEWDYQTVLDKRLLEEVMEYLDLNKSEAISMCKLAVKLNALMWAALDPQTEDQIANYYRITPFYICDLAYWHMTRRQRKFRDKIVKSASGNVLDYGGGIGDLSASLTEKGLHVTYADVQGKTFEFAKWLFERRGLSVEMLDLEQNVLSRQYDTIICLDVIQNLANPQAILENMASHLVANGKLILTIPGFDEYHPMHLNMEFDQEELLDSLGLSRTDEHWLWVKRSQNGNP